MVQFLSYRKITKLAFADENTTFLSGYVRRGKVKRKRNWQNILPGITMKVSKI